MGTKQRSTWAAVAVVSTFTALAVVTTAALPTPAHAAPSPSPAPSGSPADSGADPGSGAGSDAAGKAADTAELQKVRKQLDKLYREAAVATDEYNAAEEQAETQSKQIVSLALLIVKSQKELDGLRSRAGAAARQQYRGGGLSAEARLMLSKDPDSFLESAGRLRQGRQATRNTLTHLDRTKQDLSAYAKSASEQWKKLEGNRKAAAEARKKIKKRVAEAEKVESRLEKEERERLRVLEEAAQYKAQSAWLDSGVLEAIKGQASKQGKKAIEYATAQLGKPYEWGAEGPRTYDCSGLTSKAWLSAGRSIPRTSQEQWKQLPRIEIRDMRPGDLIIYHDDASHVGMYIGDGAIVHAPRPGRHITVAGAGSMSILGVVRPDK